MASTARPPRSAINRSSRGVKHEVHRSNSASSPASFLTVVRSWLTPAPASNVSCSSRNRTAKYEENADAASRPPGLRARPISAITVASSPATSPKPPWHSETAASKEPVATGRRRASPRTNADPGTAPSLASSTKRALMSTPTTSMPRPAKPWACRPGPQPTSSRRSPGWSFSSSMRKPTSCSVPLVNEYRRYAVPAWSATASNQWGMGGTILSPGLPRECEWAGRPIDNLTLSGIVWIKVTESDLRRKGSRMNFGKHGRAVLLGGLLVSTSTLVFGGLLGGIATAAPGTIKVGGIPAEQGGNGNDPHVDTACIGIREFGFVPGIQTTAT